MLRLAAFFTVLLGASTALAEEPGIAPSTGHEALPSAAPEAEPPAPSADAAPVASNDEVESVSEVAAEAPTRLPTLARHCSGPCNYQAWLGYLLITRDIDLPGSTFALRLLPTRHALAGATSNRIVLRANAYRADYIGLDVTARF